MTYQLDRYHDLMGETRWLNGSEDRAWRGYVRMRWLLDLQISRDLARDSGLSEADYTVLTVLSDATDQRLRLIELAERMLWSKSRLTHHIDRMAERGLVRRAAHGRSSRATDAVLTAEGRRRITAAAPLHVASVRRHFIDVLTPDQIDALGAATEAVLRHLREVGPNAEAENSPRVDD